MPSTVCRSVRPCPRWLTVSVAALVTVNGILLLLGCGNTNPNVPPVKIEEKGDKNEKSDSGSKGDTGNKGDASSKPSTPRIDPVIPVSTASIRRVALLVGIAKYGNPERR